MTQPMAGSPLPDSWHNAVTGTMERFDLEHRDGWRRRIDVQKSRLLLAVHAKLVPAAVDNVHIALAPLFPQIPASFWAENNAFDVMGELVQAVGQARAEGHEELVPTFEPGYRLFGAALLTHEENRYTGDTSVSLYLHDRAGHFYTRRHMGGRREAEVTMGYLDPTRPEPEASNAALEHPHFSGVHSYLSSLLAAFLAPRDQCQQLWGETNTNRAELDRLMGVFEDILKALADPMHPQNPMRAN